MKRLLITGFEPFGGETINPSWEAVCGLPSELSGYTLKKLQIPVVFGKGAECVLRAAREWKPHGILCIGQAGGRGAVCPELLGINLRHASLPDNEGNCPKDERILPGEDAYFSPFPVRKMAEAIRSAGVPARLSYSAGAYVCNDVFFTLLAHFRNTETKVGMIHLPYCTLQKKEPSMETDAMILALRVAIEHLDDEEPRK